MEAKENESFRCCRGECIPLFFPCRYRHGVIIRVRKPTAHKWLFIFLLCVCTFYCCFTGIWNLSFIHSWKYVETKAFFACDGRVPQHRRWQWCMHRFIVNSVETYAYTRKFSTVITRKNPLRDSKWKINTRRVREKEREQETNKNQTIWPHAVMHTLNI